MTLTTEQWQAEQDAMDQCRQQSPWLMDSIECVTNNREVACSSSSVTVSALSEVEMAVAFAKSCLENERAMEIQVSRLHKALADMHPDLVPDWDKDDYRRAVIKALGRT
jgi:hypothetical protein